jgi:hypothetical protein
MPFNVLTIRSGLSTGNEALYPELSDVSSAEVITLDEYDGPNVQKLVATAVQVIEVQGSVLKTLAKMREVKIDVYLTDGRLALACEKYDKGGGWVGFGGAGLAVAVTANLVSKARAASRSRGKVLVGHVRYPWLKSVGASAKTGVGTSEAIRLEYAEKLGGTTVRKLVELTLPKNIDATLVAREIARRAAAYRLAHYPDMTSEARAKFETLSHDPPRLEPAAKKFAFVQLPNYYFVSAKTAYPPRPSAPPRASEPSPLDAEPGLAREAGSAPMGTTPKFCDQCGMRALAGDNFCQSCGSPIEAVSVRSPAQGPPGPSAAASSPDQLEGSGRP